MQAEVDSAAFAATQQHALGHGKHTLLKLVMGAEDRVDVFSKIVNVLNLLNMGQHYRQLSPECACSGKERATRKLDNVGRIPIKKAIGKMSDGNRLMILGTFGRLDKVYAIPLCCYPRLGKKIAFEPVAGVASSEIFA
jgi:hypothetical protein